MTQVHENIAALIAAHPVVLFMKGNKEMPMCGFSAQVVNVLNVLGSDFVAHNVLEDDALRQGIKDYSDWPTIPQLYVRGEFIGGCDIVTQLYESGELQTVLGGSDGGGENPGR